MSIHNNFNQGSESSSLITIKLKTIDSETEPESITFDGV